MTHCEYLDDQNDPCQSTTPCTIRCRECWKDVCEEHQALGSQESEDYDREGDEGEITEAVHRETVLCIRCAYEIDDFERRASLRQERRKAKRVNTGEIVARGHMRAMEHDTVSDLLEALRGVLDASKDRSGGRWDTARAAIKKAEEASK